MSKYYSHRIQSRQFIRCKFQYFIESEVAEGSVWDLSRTGWRASGSQPVTIGTHMPVCLFLETEKKWVSIGRVAVRWVQGSNFGLEILEIDALELERLDQFLEEKQREARRRVARAA